MQRLPLLALALFIACACACTGSAAKEPVIEFTIAPMSFEDFRIMDPRGEGCSEARESHEGKLSPAEAELRAQLKDGQEEFVIMMKREVSLEDYPLPEGERIRIGETWTEDERYMVRSEAIGRTQVCAIGSLTPPSGDYRYSFLLINAFVARLSASEAVALSERADVKSVELSETKTPPPF